MGALDSLLGRLYDDASSSRRDKVQAVKELRKRLDAELYDYAVQIEQLRVTLQDLRDSITRQVAEEQQHETVAKAVHAFEDGMYGSPLTEGPLDQEVNQLGGSLEEARDSLPRVYYSDFAQHHREVSRLDAARSQAARLDAAWARVRPLLDEGYQLELVAAIRAHRHDLRHAVQDTLHALLDARLHGRLNDLALLSDLDFAVSVLDGWSLRVTKLRTLSRNLKAPRDP